MEKNIQTWYRNAYPADEMGNEINPNITFGDVYKTLIQGKSFYEFVKAYDSIVRERIFTEMANRGFDDYDTIHNLWVKGNMNRK